MEAILCGNCEKNIFYTLQDGADLVLKCFECGFIIRLKDVLTKGTKVSINGEI